MQEFNLRLIYIFIVFIAPTFLLAQGVETHQSLAGQVDDNKNVTNTNLITDQPIVIDEDELSGVPRAVKPRKQQFIKLDNSLNYISGKGGFLDLSKYLGEGIQVFVRDENILSWEEPKLIANVANGYTEAFLVNNDKMDIIRIQVSSHQKNQSNRALATKVLASKPLIQNYLEPEKPTSQKSSMIGESTTAQLQMMQVVPSEPGSPRPLDRVALQIVGFERVYQSNDFGLVVIEDVPVQGDFLVKVSDPVYQRFLPTTVSIHSDSEVIEMVSAKDMTWMLSASSASLDYENYANVCGQVPVTGKDKIEVVFNQKPLKSFYFDDYSKDKVVFSLKSKHVGKDGVFCAFDLKPGPAIMDVIVNGKLESSGLHFLHAGNNEFIRIPELKTEFHLQAGLKPAAAIYGDARDLDSQHLIKLDDVGLSDVALDSDLLNKLSSGAYYFENLSPKGDSYIYAKDGVLESTVYKVNSFDQVIPMMNFGTFEFLMQSNEIYCDPDKGSIYAEYLDTSKGGPYQVEIINSKGEAITSDSINVPGRVSSKSYTCNLPVGLFSIHVRDEVGNWLASETLQVFESSASVIAMGDGYKFR